MTRFGRLEGVGLLDLLVEAARKAMADAGVEVVDHVFVGAMSTGMTCGLSAVASALVDRLHLFPAAAERVENGPASGGSALAAAVRSVASGSARVALVVGGEKTTHLAGPDATSAVATLTHPEVERPTGVTLPALAAMLARAYSAAHELSDHQRLKVAVKNHANGALNPLAHFQRAITLEQALSSPVVSDPLRLYDCCPLSDGAAALVLAEPSVAGSLGRPAVEVAGVGQATDLHAYHERPDLLDFPAVRRAAETAFSRAGLGPGDVDVAELHDAFTGQEILSYEDCGFAGHGEGHRLIDDGVVAEGGELPVNLSGGLIGCGHAVGATGIYQGTEIVRQLRGEAVRQVDGAERGFLHSVGGPVTAYCVCVAMERG